MFAMRSGSNMRLGNDRSSAKRASGTDCGDGCNAMFSGHWPRPSRGGFRLPPDAAVRSGAKGRWGCRASPCTPEVAQRHSGYQVCGTSPYALRKAMPLYVESSVLELPQIYINAGRRGLLLGMPPAPLRDLLGAVPVRCALPQR